MTGPQFFNENKRGEIVELRKLLRNCQSSSDVLKRREVLQKVIAYMTNGYDISSLFSDVVLTSATNDLISKKMCYLYLSKYAQYNEELSTLCVNTMTKDCRDPDPSIRGLAIRALSSLKLNSVSGYLLPIIQNGLSDVSPYVRRNSVLAILKVHSFDPERILPKREEEADFPVVDTLYNMIVDNDSSVVTACMFVLSEILLDEGGIQVNKKLINHLMDRIQSFEEWGMSMILELLIKHNPSDKEDIFLYMNILDPLLKLSSSQIVLGVTKCFLVFAEKLPDLKLSIYSRIKKPILTLLASSREEIKFALLKHIYIIVLRYPGVFDSDFKLFFLWHNESWTIKQAKLKILCELANDRNLYEIVNELNIYVTDMNDNVVKSAVQSFSRVAVKVPNSAEGIVNQLLQLCNPSSSIVIWSECLKVIVNWLRKNPTLCVDVLNCMSRFVYQVLGFAIQDSEVSEHSSVIKSLLYILGNFGKRLTSTPKLIEAIRKRMDNKTHEDVWRELFWTTLQTFHVRPDELKDVLKEVVKDIASKMSTFTPFFQDELSAILSTLKANKFEEVFVKFKQVKTFVEDDLSQEASKLFTEFNTLSIIYGKLEVSFTQESYCRKTADKRDGDNGFLTSEGKKKDTCRNESNDDLLNLNVPDVKTSQETKTANPTAISETVDIDDLLGAPIKPSPVAREEPDNSLEAFLQGFSGNTK